MENIDLHVVIADSNVQDRESKKKIMEGMGMKVVLSTGDGSKALETIKQKRVDVVVMDMILPGVDGIGILEEVNNSNQKNRPIFIVETALRMENLVEQAIQSGADYFTFIPVLLDNLNCYPAFLQKLCQINTHSAAAADNNPLCLMGDNSQVL